MLTKNHYINILSLLFLYLINVLVVLNFSENITKLFLINILLFALIFFAILILIDKKVDSFSNIQLSKYHYLTGLTIPVVLFIIIKTLPYTYNNENYFTNLIWLQNYQGGVYHYNYTDFTYNLPVIYYLIEPFYQFGDLAYFTLTGLLVLSLLVLFSSSTKKEMFTKFSAILFLPLIYRELYYRSDLLGNAVLFIAILYLMKRFLDPGKINFRFLLLGMAAGLMLCTRLLFTIPFILMLLFFFRNNIKHLFIFLLISAIIYFMFVFPFMNLDYRLFSLYGPYSGSLSTLPIWVYMILLLIISYLGWMISDLRELIFSSGILIGIVALVFSGKGELINNLVLTLPFFVLSLKEERIEKFTGKIIRL